MTGRTDNYRRSFLKVWALTGLGLTLGDSFWLKTKADQKF